MKMRKLTRQGHGMSLGYLETLSRLPGSGVSKGDDGSYELTDEARRAYEEFVAPHTISETPLTTII